jgi:hypothetical protein
MALYRLEKTHRTLVAVVGVAVRYRLVLTIPGDKWRVVGGRSEHIIDTQPEVYVTE